MKHCTKCGNKILEDVKFCKHCGSKTKKESKKEEDSTTKTKTQKKPSYGIFWVIGVVVLIIILTVPTRTITCSRQVPYDVSVPYEVEVPYYVNYDYSVTMDKCYTDFGDIFDIYAFHRIFVVNNEDEGGTFKITSVISTPRRGQMRDESSSYIQPHSSGEFEFSADVDYNEDPNCEVLVSP